MAAWAAHRHPRDMSEHITHTPTIKRLERTTSDKWLAGVCGGLGRYFDLNPALFRLGLVVLTLLGGAGILVYLAAILVMPAEGQDMSIAEDALAKRRDQPGKLVGLGLVAVAIFVLLSQAHTWPTAGASWVLILIAGFAILWSSKSERRGRRILVAAITAFVLAIVAAIAAVIVAFSWFDVSLADGVGDHASHPATAADVQKNYKLGIGTLEIDLSKVQAADVNVRAHVGIGELRVIVPAQASIDAHTVVKAGDTNDPVLQGTGTTTVHLDLHLGAGHIEILRAA